MILHGTFVAFLDPVVVQFFVKRVSTRLLLATFVALMIMLLKAAFDELLTSFAHFGI